MQKHVKKYHSENAINSVAKKHKPTKHSTPAQELVMIDKAFEDCTSSKYGCFHMGINIGIVSCKA